MGVIHDVVQEVVSSRSRPREHCDVSVWKFASGGRGGSRRVTCGVTRQAGERASKRVKERAVKV